MSVWMDCWMVALLLITFVLVGLLLRLFDRALKK